MFKLMASLAQDENQQILMNVLYKDTFQHVQMDMQDHARSPTASSALLRVHLSCSQSEHANGMDDSSRRSV